MGGGEKTGGVVEGYDRWAFVRLGRGQEEAEVVEGYDRWAFVRFGARRDHRHAGMAGIEGILIAGIMLQNRGVMVRQRI